MDMTRKSFSAALIAILALAVVAAAVIWRTGSDEPTPHRASASAVAPTTASTSPAPVAAAAAPAAPAPAVPAAAAPAPTTSPPPPVLPDGQHPVYLTDVDVAGWTVEVDLLQHLATPEEREAYYAAHPEEEEEEYYESPFRNDSNRLRRLPVLADITVGVVQQVGVPECGGPYFMDFAVFSENVRSRSYGTGRLGPNPFWITVHDGTITGLQEVGCAG
jgi:hypothetical protein